jgi:hypothetical protein
MAGSIRSGGQIPALIIAENVAFFSCRLHVVMTTVAVVLLLAVALVSVPTSLVVAC